ncbi:hypothetical protein EN859_032860 [Mesorhizobium sp. M00.F.Ca.ET.216.01.1.1]|nr:hypothetical protein EN859_032860 [Mesorhizobium sp. M00.F.Ca.ET.216.01.1.1]TJW39886.1 MAG: hypothetical protein E5W83_29895 [Mesorhizobium sp.]
MRPRRVSAAPRRRGRADRGRCRAAPIFWSDKPRPTRRIRNPTRRPSPMAPIPAPKARPRHGACAVKTAT